MPDDSIGYVLSVYPARGLPPERSDFEDEAKAQKAFTDAKFFSILWQSRPPTQGLGWIKLKEKEAPPQSATPPAAAKPSATPTVPVPMGTAAKPTPAPPANASVSAVGPEKPSTVTPDSGKPVEAAH